MAVPPTRWVTEPWWLAGIRWAGAARATSTTSSVARSGRVGVMPAAAVPHPARRALVSPTTKRSTAHARRAWPRPGPVDDDLPGHDGYCARLGAVAARGRTTRTASRATAPDR